MTDYIERLQYLADNSAEEEDRKALTAAVIALKCVKRNAKLSQAKKAKDAVDPKDPQFIQKIKEATASLNYPEDEWMPITLKQVLKGWGITECNLSEEELQRPVHVLEDDGMGYGAIHALAFDSYKDKDELSIWI